MDEVQKSLSDPKRKQPERTDTGYLTPCLLHTGYIDRGGYGRVGKSAPCNMGEEMAHRAAWVRKNGTIPSGMFLDHLCRVRHCVNPDHLEIVSHAENVRRGDKAKLTQEQAIEAVSRYESGESAKRLSEEYGVSYHHMRKIVKYKWCWS
jgi:hypothetical protein